MTIITVCLAMVAWNLFCVFYLASAWPLRHRTAAKRCSADCGRGCGRAPRHAMLWHRGAPREQSSAAAGVALNTPALLRSRCRRVCLPLPTGQAARAQLLVHACGRRARAGRCLRRRRRPLRAVWPPRACLIAQLLDSVWTSATCLHYSHAITIHGDAATHASPPLCWALPCRLLVRQNTGDGYRMCRLLVRQNTGDGYIEWNHLAAHSAHGGRRDKARCCRCACVFSNRKRHRKRHMPAVYATVSCVAGGLLRPVSLFLLLFAFFLDP